MLCHGPAGTGKTYLAVAMAVAALKAERLRKIVLVRPAVEAGESLGFLPGDLQAKLNPYLRPLMDALREMMDYDLIKRYTEEDLIEVIPLAYMRGRTLNEAFIILDEAQNTTVAQMKMFLTRMGAGSKIVVSGDITQIDLPAARQERAGRRPGASAGDRGDRRREAHRGRHRPPSAGAADRRRLRRRSAETASLDERHRTMNDHGHGRSENETRSERVAALELPPGQWERAWISLRRRDVLGRIGLALLAAAAMCVVIAAGTRRLPIARARAGARHRGRRPFTQDDRRHPDASRRPATRCAAFSPQIPSRWSSCGRRCTTRWWS